MNRSYIFSLLALLVVSIFSFTANSNSPEDLAKNAFYEIEADPFNSYVVKSAAKKISDAYNIEPENPWVLVAFSRLILEMGYRRGDRSELETYAPGTIEKAGEYAEEAIKNGKNLSMAHVQYSKIQMINGDLKGAWLTLNKAHQLAPDDFYPWYYRGVISIRMNDFEKAYSYLHEAEVRAEMFYQKSWVASRQINVAKIIGDEKEIESAYLNSIRVNPGSAHLYGNFANYLKRKKRYKEAITYYEKAISIASYPAAREGLEEAKQLLNQQ